MDAMNPLRLSKDRLVVVARMLQELEDPRPSLRPDGWSYADLKAVNQLADAVALAAHAVVPDAPSECWAHPCTNPAMFTVHREFRLVDVCGSCEAELVSLYGYETVGRLSGSTDVCACGAPVVVAEVVGDYWKLACESGHERLRRELI